jgi:hypothetical protein
VNKEKLKLLGVSLLIAVGIVVAITAFTLLMGFIAHTFGPIPLFVFLGITVIAVITLEIYYSNHKG